MTTPMTPFEPSRTLRTRPGTLRRRRPVSVDPENLDINKPLNFHHEETTIHWSEAL
ncbi:hypothetical protein [Streptomyces arboris]|uniref:hypothetical protein n=1 Tax=Streptomyces arboris TaxID=2600619 RepID=UPI003624CE17